MHHFASGSRGLGLILEVAFDRLLFPVAIVLSLAFGGAILGF